MSQTQTSVKLKKFVWTPSGVDFRKKFWTPTKNWHFLTYVGGVLQMNHSMDKDTTQKLSTLQTALYDCLCKKIMHFTTFWFQQSHQNEQNTF